MSVRLYIFFFGLFLWDLAFFFQSEAFVDYFVETGVCRFGSLIFLFILIYIILIVFNFLLFIV